MADFKVGCSPFTSKIYAGNVLKNGLWGKTKHEVTDMCVAAVAQHLIQRDKKVEFKCQGKSYVLNVEII